jgi:hypothetical protein
MLGQPFPEGGGAFALRTGFLSLTLARRRLGDRHDAEITQDPPGGASTQRDNGDTASTASIPG